MGKTIRHYKGEELKDKSRKKKSSRKSFMHREENWSSKSNGGPGNKRYWDNKLITKDQYIKYKNKDYEEGIDGE